MNKMSLYEMIKRAFYCFDLDEAISDDKELYLFIQQTVKFTKYIVTRFDKEWNVSDFFCTYDNLEEAEKVFNEIKKNL